MMGFEVVGNFAHTLEDRFENYRTGKDLLDRDTTTLVLRCVDYFRDFISRLRRGDASEHAPGDLIQRLKEIDEQHARTGTSKMAETPVMISIDSPPRAPVERLDSISGGILIRIKFKSGLQLADLKARLIVSRLSSIGEVVACEPRIEDVHSFDELPLFSLTLLTERPLAEVRKIVNVDGVDSIDLEGAPTTSAVVPITGVHEISPAVQPVVAVVPKDATASIPETPTAVPSASHEPTAVDSSPTSAPQSTAAPGLEPSDPKATANETLRIDIDRLDRLMNLTGELVVTNARFAQITSQMNPIFRQASVFNKSRDLTERLRHRFQLVRQQLGNANSSDENWNAVFEGLEDELEGLEEQSLLWDEGHSQFLKITEAVDQLSLVSRNLQRGVLNTRMVPVGPLLNRFKRVIRDLSVERGKKVQLLIQGEKTELDRRMIDALGDPLLHLIRNSIDHGLETTAERKQAGKPEAGTIRLEATHRGNNVLITVQDDGGGIRADRIRDRLVARQLATAAQVKEMSEQQIIDQIWQPGFSTAEQVSEVSGRGVGMDIVRSAISDLSGTIDVVTRAGQGTTFTIRLPLTLAIIRSLIIRFRNDHFSIPIDDVREIVSVSSDQVYSVHRHSTIDVRGEMIPLARMGSIFQWNQASDVDSVELSNASRNFNVVILHARGKTLGLCVDALVGRADIVIKSLTDNFVAIRGISGASIMGDGAVCQMLDCLALVELATERASLSTASL